MASDLRREIAELCAQADKESAECDEFLRRLAEQQAAKRQAERQANMVRKTFLPREQPRAAVTNDAAWNTWRDARVAAVIGKKLEDFAGLIGEFTGKEDAKLYRKIAALHEENKKLNDQIADLHSEMALLRTFSKSSSVVRMPGKVIANVS